jgi:hypothetical protein
MLRGKSDTILQFYPSWVVIGVAAFNAALNLPTVSEARRLFTIRFSIEEMNCLWIALGWSLANERSCPRTIGPMILANSGSG